MFLRKSRDCMEIVFYYMDLNKVFFVGVIITGRKYDAINLRLIQIIEVGYRVLTREAFLPLCEMC